MKKKTIITVLITLIAGIIVMLTSMTDKIYEDINTYYQVYLNGNRIGIIDNENKLYNLIDDNQSSIKSEYNVNTVYPPTDLKIVPVNTYEAKTDDVNMVYDRIEENDNFAIKGYVITIKGAEKTFKVNVLDKNVFYEAAKRFVRAFLDENEYDKYINNNQDEIVDVGRKILDMKFSENITIKEDYINVNEHIYKDELELSQFLLFGSEPDTKSYTVKLGDTIESVADSNQLNVEEFLIANTNYKSSEAILRVGDKVNVTLIDPQLTFVYDLYEISDEVAYYVNKTVNDNTKYVGYKVVTTPGQNGINRVTEKYTVTNGEREQGVEAISTVPIKEVVNQITTVGTKYYSTYVPSNPVVVTGDWGWPTNQGYVITSRYAWRWGKMHNGIDISGAGNFNSPIYAANDGRVVYTYSACPSRGKGISDTCGGSLGNQVTIEHADGYYTKYGHMTSNVRVRIGQTVKRGDIIGYMGNSGSSTGVHLHFAVAKGSQTSYFNPMSLYR